MNKWSTEDFQGSETTLYDDNVDTCYDTFIKTHRIYQEWNLMWLMGDNDVVTNPSVSGPKPRPCTVPFVPTDGDWVQSSRAETLFFDQGMEKGELLLSGHLPRLGGAFHDYRLWRGRIQFCQACVITLPLLRPLCSGRFCTRCPITILVLRSAPRSLQSGILSGSWEQGQLVAEFKYWETLGTFGW